MSKGTDIDEKSYAMTALLVFALDRIVVVVLNLLRGGMAPSDRMLWLNATTLVFSWAMPLIVVSRIEKRDAGSLGVAVSKERRRLYALYLLVGVVLPMMFFRSVEEYFTELLEQVVFIGFAEEFFFRGYMMTRFCAWLGETEGLLLNAFVFSLAHAVFVASRYGLAYPLLLAQSSLQTFAGGLLLGYIFLRSRSILLGSILHTSLNLSLPRILG
ncbi:MAG: CPBP family intramembrane metalloprotease [Candidatus Bathyarchaeota archaeon]|nr:MAG: CPBP family intramembrane metalloprotease [Candidatus Bathyarchaeota archaeon]